MRNVRKPIAQADGGDPLYVVDALIVPQGPNYALAKRMQHWRAMVARETHECVVSSNIAPSTATVSVVQNRTFAWAYNGMHHFKPLEVMQQETSNAVCGAMLIADLRDPTCVAHPSTPLRNPLELFAHGSFHGGAWRCGFKFGSVGEVAALVYFVAILGGTYYLAAYNFAQVAGWSVVVARLAQLVASGSSAQPWATVAAPLSLFQNLAGLEVVHCYLGLVKAPFMTTLIQVLSRVQIIAILNTYGEQIGGGWAMWAIGAAWGITEVVRYLSYGLGLLNIKIYPITWLRYTMFIVLYPTGVSGELGLIYASAKAHMANPAIGTPILDYVERTLGFELPLVTLFWCVAVPVYVFGLGGLYSYMLSQRSKALGYASKKKD